MKTNTIHIGELINLATNSPVFDGDTLSRHTMAALIEAGIAKKTETGHNVITEHGKYVYSRLLDETISVHKQVGFTFD